MKNFRSRAVALSCRGTFRGSNLFHVSTSCIVQENATLLAKFHIRYLCGYRGEIRSVRLRLRFHATCDKSCFISFFIFRTLLFIADVRSLLLLLFHNRSAEGTAVPRVTRVFKKITRRSGNYRESAESYEVRNRREKIDRVTSRIQLSFFFLHTHISRFPETRTSHCFSCVFGAKFTFISLSSLKCFMSRRYTNFCRYFYHPTLWFDCTFVVLRDTRYVFRSFFRSNWNYTEN